MNINIIKLSENATIPTYGSEGAACFDLYAAQDAKLLPGEKVIVSTDLAVEVPENHVMMIYSRSGMGIREDIRLSNCTGVIDSDYRGTIVVALTSDKGFMDGDIYHVKKGDRIAQAMIIPVERTQFTVAAQLTHTKRGASGFGSSGK